jgi:site-specific recombinase XerD
VKIKAFIESLSTQTSSKETLRAYRQDIQRFAEFLASKGLRTNQVKPSTIADYVNYLGENLGRTSTGTLSPATIARRLAVISRYYDWLRDNSDSPVNNPVARVRRPKVQNDAPKAVNESALTSLVKCITDVRDRAIILLFLYSGLRLSELVQLNKDSITLRKRKANDGSVEFYGSGEVIGKRRKRRQFIVGPTAMQALGAYIAAHRTIDDLKPLFLSSRKTRLSCRAMQQILDKWCRRAGVDHIHVHQLRHCFATRNVNAGMSSTILQQLMGHSNLTTTQRYFHVREERLMREYHAAMEFVALTATV